MTDEQKIADAVADLKATVLATTETTVVSPLKTAEESVENFRAKTMADIASLKAQVDLLHQRMNDAVEHAKALETFVYNKGKSVELETAGVWARIKHVFGGK